MSWRKPIYLAIIFIFLGFFTPTAHAGWTDLTYDDFESGWGNYTDGGGDCSLYTYGTYAHQGSNAADIQDNSGVSSSFYYTNGIDVDTPGYTQLRVEFWYIPISMDNSAEDFWLQYYDGTDWHTVETWARGVDFDNGYPYNPTVYIDESSYTFPTDMRIRFMCDASNNRDDVYIDEIRVSGYIADSPPGQASSPNPANSATDVSISADLSWTAGSGATSHDVYFGTSSPGSFQGNQTATTFDPGTMANSTTYYWRIDEVNAAGTTTGNVWSFTTEAVAPPLPGPASNPSPSNGADNVNINADLSWSAGSNATSHDVYFGTSSPGTFQGNQTATTFDPGTMAYDTTYYWRIDEINATGTTTGTVWNFTTETDTGGVELLVNPGFESGTSPWYIGDANQITVSNEDPHSGIYSAKFVGNNTWLLMSQLIDPAQEGVTYDVSGWMKTVSVTTQGQIWLQYLDSGWAIISESLVGSATGSTAYTQYSDSLVSPTGTAILRVRLVMPNGTGTIYYDDLSVSEATSGAPGQASNPSPADSATGVSIDADLSWTAGTGSTSSDIYFGTSSPGTFQGNQTATTFDPGTMANDTIYYWRIDEINAAGTTAGNVWSFTTEAAAPPLPGPASNPSPTTGATNVNINADLSWSAGSNATSHDVYFGTSSPGSFQGNQTATTFDPGTMANDTTYYWRIDEVNVTGTTVGTVWSFTTIVAAPGQASSPSPADSATDIAVDADLSWTAGSGATSHDVYFGTSSPGTFQGNQTVTTFDTGTMANSTTYYWRIDEINAGGTTAGTVWSFTTEAAGPPLPGPASNPTPTTGATNVNINADLSWTAGSNATSHDVYFGTSSPGSFQGNQTATTFDAGTMANDTTYYWRIDEVNITGTTTGTVWNFTTIVAAPGAASGPSPSDSATDIAVDADLSWTAGSGATSRDVYFGTSSPGSFQGNQTATTFDPGTMANDTIYYWRIDEVNAGGTTAGNVWSFTTIVAASGQASSPSPVDSATDIAVDADLNWTAGSGATSHDVYFGTSSPGSFQGNQAVTTFDPGTMANDMTYYWRIDEVNAGGTTTGAVWSFATIVAAPGQASSPSPADSATSVSIGADLSWTAGSSATSHDVYFGTSSPGAFQGNQTATTFDPGTMANDTTYYWRIDELNTAGTTTGSVWSFTTEPEMGGEELLTNPGFESGITPWYVTDANYCTVSTDDPHSGIYSGKIVGADTWLLMSQFVDPAQEGVTYYVSGWLKTVNVTTYAEIWLQFLDSGYGIISESEVGQATGSTSYTQYSDSLVAPAGTVILRIRLIFASGTGTAYFDDISVSTVDTSGYASNPYPADTDVNVPLDSVLNWTSGAYVAATAGHELYLGTDFDDVNNSDPSVFIGALDTNSYNPGGLSYDTTYYWAVDEVNGVDTWYGDVWSFTTSTSGTILLVDFGATAGQNIFGPIGWNTVIKDVYTDYVDIGPGGTTIVIAQNPWYDYQGVTGSARDFVVDERIVVTWYNNSASQITFTPKLSFTDPNRPDESWYSMSQTVIAPYGTETSEFTIDAASAGTYSLVNVNCFYTHNQILICDKIELTTEAAPPSPPGQASNPSPADSATDVSINTDLSWTAGSGSTSSDVYFGTSSPGSFQGNQTATTFDPGTMANDTTYYWRIDEVNADGTTTGAVWSFTTEAAAVLPGQASNPSPANSATSISIDTDLSWTAGSDTTSHDVYFGTSSPGSFQGNQTATTFDTGTMANDTTYYWRIDEVNAAGTTTGTVWIFTTIVALPGQTSNPNPADDATGVSVDADLSWTGGAGATSYNVYFGTAAPAPYQGNQLDTTFDPGTMANDTTYYWRVDSVNEAGATPGIYWNFTTVAGGGAGTGLTGDYYDNIDFTAFVLTRVDATVNFNWGTGSPDPSIGVDTFSVRWTGQVEPLYSETYTFYTTSDDGVRLWVDSQLVVDSWIDQSPTEHSGTIALTGGVKYDIQIDFYENGGGAVAELRWSSGSQAKEIIPQSQLYESAAPQPPGQASSPSPGNGATDVSVDADISWSAGSGATSHDVYFGTSSPGSFQGNQTATTFDPGTMNNDTTYYWRINEINAQGTTTGTVWSFTTEAGAPTPPGQASNPSPANGATDVSVNADLSWTAGSGSTSRDVYFGTSSPGTYRGNQTATTYDTGTMANDTTYYWRIDEINAGGTTTGVVWNFTTSAAPVAGQASNPNPSNGATNVSIMTDLSWTPGTGSTSSDVYFGTTSPGDFQVNQVGVIFDPGALDNNTTYYWRIDEVSGSGTTTGNVWNFTTEVTTPPGSNILGWWKFDETSGSTAADSSGYDNTGNLFGEPNWMPGKIHGGLYFRGDSTSDYVEVTNDPNFFDITNEITIAAWVTLDYATNYAGLVTKGLETAWALQTAGYNDKISFFVAASGVPWNGVTGSTNIGNGLWHHVAGVYDGTAAYVYIDGVEDGKQAASGPIGINNWDVRIGGNSESTTWRHWEGMIDDVRIYDRALSPAEIADLAGVNYAIASNPNPPNGAADVEVSALLMWTPGGYATSHDVYFGTTRPGDFQGNETSAMFSPGLLEYDTTYYWSITEVDGAQSWPGDVWSFTTESAPQPPGAEASDPRPADGLSTVSTGIHLKWMLGTDATSHDVYFGTSSPGTFQGNQISTVFDPGTLNDSTTYYWRIDELSAGGTTTGDVWNFATTTEETLLLTSIETQNDITNNWTAETGTMSLSNRNVTEGDNCLQITYGQVAPRFEYARDEVDISGYDKIRFDVYLEGTQMTLTAKFWDVSWNSYTSFYYLLRPGRTIVEYNIAGLASKLDTTRFNRMLLFSDETFTGNEHATIYIDNVRVTRGGNDDGWLKNLWPGEPIISEPDSIIPNGDFELGLQYWGSWGQFDGGDYLFSGATGENNAKSGQYSMTIFCLTEGRGGFYSGEDLSLEAGDWELSYWARGSEPGAEMRHTFVGGSLSGQFYSSTFSVPTTWTKYTYSFTANSQSDCMLYIFAEGIGTLYVDAVSCTKPGVPGYDPGQAQGPPRIVTTNLNKTLVDGSLYFPIGIYGGEPSVLGPTSINTLTSVDSSSNMLSILDDCETYGIMALPALTGIARGHVTENAGIAIDHLKNHPAVLCWYNCDEPDHNKWNVPPPEIRFMSQKIAEVDVDHPSSVLVMPWSPSNMYQYADTVDVYMADVYEWNMWNLTDQMDVLRDSAGPDKPVWIILRAFAEGADPEPTTDYLYCSAYSALAHTADGVIWFSYSYCQSHPNVWSTVQDIAAELEVLSPALVSDTSPIAVTDSHFNVHTIMKEYNGNLYLIAVNIGDAATGVQITIPGATATQADVWFESRTVPISSGVITDDFGYRERHVYVFPAP